MGDVIKASGWDLVNYVAGGSVLWAHDPTTLPVAKPIKTYVQGDKLWSVAQYPTAEESQFADTVYKLALGGYLRGASIGMRPIEYKLDEGRRSAEHSYPMIFSKQELLEWSHTPIPANPEALLQAKSLGIDTAPVRSWCEQALDGAFDLVGVERCDVEKAWAVTCTSTTTSIPAPTVIPVVEKEMPEEYVMDVNAMLDSLLQIAPMLTEANDAGTLDHTKVGELINILQSVHQATESTEPIQESAPVMASVEASVEAPTTKSNPHGTEALASKSHEDLTEDDIRGIVREVMSAGLSRKPRK
jgi:phage head maturation protease